MKEDYQFKFLLEKARGDLLEWEKTAPKIMGITLGRTNAISRAYFPAVEYTVKKGNEFLDKMLKKTNLTP